MGLRPRLGANSSVRVLDVEVVDFILGKLVKPPGEEAASEEDGE